MAIAVLLQADLAVFPTEITKYGRYRPNRRVSEIGTSEYSMPPEARPPSGRADCRICSAAGIDMAPGSG